MEINTDAPAVARGKIEVAAPPEVVWAVLTGIADWPSWNPDVKSATLDGPLAAGTQFRWKAGPGTITSTLRSVEPPRRIEWTGTTVGIKAIHVHQFEQQGEKTIVRSAESWDGLPVRLLRGSMAKTLQKAVDSGLRHLRAEAERRA
ncbi:MAG TPA: SRPBCC family protein [Gaiellaceae bacterium]|nr:SRPBCC family protein [Gaiellaceae bacterium]